MPQQPRGTAAAGPRSRAGHGVIAGTAATVRRAAKGDHDDGTRILSCATMKKPVKLGSREIASEERTLDDL
ncbi:hypothetical protein OG618_01280 [Kitasatospora sp. NBC_01246]|uniref:hypothetical protein n=1 Tax=Kitasatospora sp. NBC_01246 TaxID=2903570 RepID=UPI002E3548AF|nr:hypothetical protein [Kitasatospora sp. NBC_01246]